MIGAALDVVVLAMVVVGRSVVVVFRLEVAAEPTPSPPDNSWICTGAPPLTTRALEPDDPPQAVKATNATPAVTTAPLNQLRRNLLTR